jgi:putative redox protein
MGTCYALFWESDETPSGAVMQTASIQWIGKEKFVATSPSGHAITIDSDRTSNKAPGPMELVLMALGACTATDVVSILKKKRQKLEALEVVCSGERASEPPTVWTKLEILYRLHGVLDETAVKRAIELSEQKYCSVSAMLQKTAKLTWRHEILPPAE